MSERTALALPVLQKSLATEGRNPVFAMTPDERAELGEVSDRPLIIKYDGKEGKFKNIDTEETLLELTGAILGVTFSQTMFPPDGEEQSWPKWICRSEDVRQKPYLHPEMNQSQKGEALARGAGTSCEGCRLREFGEGTKPVCTGAVNLMWADSKLGEIATVQASGTSITAVKHYLNWFKRRNESLLVFQTRLYPGEKQSKGGGKNWQPLALQKGAENKPEDVEKLVRAAADAEIQEATPTDRSELESISELAPDPSPVPARPAPVMPQPLRGRGVTLRPTGPTGSDQAELESALNEMGIGDEAPPPQELFAGW
jgi:hypothetical protein